MSDNPQVAHRAVNMERVDDLIGRIMQKFPGESASAQARYFAAVHLELAPLAMNIEWQRDRLFEALQNCATDEGPEQEWLDRARTIISEVEQNRQRTIEGCAMPRDPSYDHLDLSMGMAKDWQHKCLDIGFEYWLNPDSHGLICTKERAVEMMEELLGVEVRIDSNPIKDDALNSLAKLFHNGEEFEGDDGLIIGVDINLWNEGCEAIETLIGGEEASDE